MGLRLESARHARVAAEGEAVIVMVDYRSNQKVPVGDALRARIEKLEAAP
jgi:acyl-CoA thioesterase FadM